MDIFAQVLETIQTIVDMLKEFFEGIWNSLTGGNSDDEDASTDGE